MRIQVLGVLLILLSAGCDGKGSTPAPSGGNQDMISDTSDASAGTAPPSPFDRETAETLTAMHFSDLNRQAKYQRYKGLLIDIDTIFPASEDGSATFRIQVQGRVWETPSRDTITRAFRDTISFTAAWNGRSWTARANEE